MTVLSREQVVAFRKSAERRHLEAQTYSAGDVRDICDTALALDEGLRAMLDEHCPLGEHENGEIEYCQLPACTNAIAILNREADGTGATPSSPRTTA